MSCAKIYKGFESDDDCGSAEHSGAPVQHCGKYHMETMFQGMLWIERLTLSTSLPPAGSLSVSSSSPVFSSYRCSSAGVHGTWRLKRLQEKQDRKVDGSVVILLEADHRKVKLVLCTAQELRRTTRVSNSEIVVSQKYMRIPSLQHSLTLRLRRRGDQNYRLMAVRRRSRCQRVRRMKYSGLTDDSGNLSRTPEVGSSSKVIVHFSNILAPRRRFRTSDIKWKVTREGKAFPQLLHFVYPSTKSSHFSTILCPSSPTWPVSSSTPATTFVKSTSIHRSILAAFTPHV